MDNYPEALRQYLDEVEKAKKEFGGDVVVVYHNGKFYDVYGNGEKGCDVHRVSDVCNTQWFVRRSNDGFYQCGLRAELIEEKCARLTDAGLTVVRMDQGGVSKSSKMQYDRKTTRIYSPGLPPETGAHADETNILAVVLPGRRNGRGGFGYATADGATGRFVLSQLEDLAALHRAGVRDNPKETVVVRVGSETPTVDLSGRGFGLVVEFEADPVTLTDAHVEETLRRVYGDVPAPHDAEGFLGAPDAPLGCRAFVQLLHLMYRRNDSLLRDISRPTVFRERKGLRIHADGLEQLEVLSFGVLRCRTNMGVRTLRERLSFPSNIASVINARLDSVDDYKRDWELSRWIHGRLGEVGDVERIGRRIACGSAAPGDLVLLKTSLDALTSIMTALVSERPEHRPDMETVETLLVNLCTSVDAASVDGYSENFFVEGIYPRLDEVFMRSRVSALKVARVLDALNAVAGYIPGGKERHFTKHEQQGATELAITETRFKKCRREVAKRQYRVRENPSGSGGEAVEVLSSTTGFPAGSLEGDTFINGCDIGIKKRGAKFSVTNNEIEGLLADMDESKASSERLLQETFLEFCGAFHRRNAAVIERVCEIAADIDIGVCAGLQSAKRGHVRPSVCAPVGGRGTFFEARGLRHPAFDTLDTSTRDQYVPNDVLLGGGRRGILIYGANGSGKSCLMKSVGVAVVMAQAGLHVAADRLEMATFDDLFTRFPRGDDIRRGRSTFVNEMKDVMYMIENVDDGWLVIGDEMCSGTNHLGATAVVGAGIKHIARTDCKFIFATHMINVAKHTRDVSGLAVNHLTVKRTPGGIVYERKLCDGTGDVNYTLDVCAGLGFPSAFIEEAARINKLEQGVASLDYITTTKKSRYNSRVFVDRCEECGGVAEHVHHVVPQHGAPVHVKNRRFNLRALCRECHVEVHRREPGVSDEEGDGCSSRPEVLAVGAAVEEL